MVAKQGRRMSLGTSGVLSDMSCVTCLAPVAARVGQAFREPEKVASYLNSATFANDIIQLCKTVCPIFEEEERCLHLQPPCYVFGDVHGVSHSNTCLACSPIHNDALTMTLVLVFRKPERRCLLFATWFASATSARPKVHSY